MGSSLGIPDFIFEFKITGFGWATVVLNSGTLSTSQEFTVSHVTDALGDFVTALADICRSRRGSSRVIWEQEPAEICCTMTRAEDGVGLAIGIQARPQGGAVWKPVTMIESTVAVVVRSVVAGCDRIERASYEEDWPFFPFPQAVIDRLRERIASADF